MFIITYLYFQEVKHPLPFGDGDKVVRISPTDKTALLRYNTDEPVKSIKGRLNFPTKLDETDDSFFLEKSKRLNMPYLGKVFQNNRKVTLQPLKETSLSQIATQAMNLSLEGKKF